MTRLRVALATQFRAMAVRCHQAGAELRDRAAAARTGGLHYTAESLEHDARGCDRACDRAIDGAEYFDPTALPAPGPFEN